MVAFLGWKIPIFAILFYARVVCGSIGPVAELHITNGDVAPDGFHRQAILVEGTSPGPLITGRKVDYLFKIGTRKLTLHITGR